MAKKDGDSGWEPRLRAIKKSLGESYARLEEELLGADPKKGGRAHGFKKWRQKKPKAIWAQLGRGIPYVKKGAAKVGLGIFVEPATMDDKGYATSADLTLEIAVYLKIPLKADQYDEHDELLAWLEHQAKVAFPELREKALTAVYPNPSPKPQGHPFLYGWNRHSDEADKASVLWIGLVAPGPHGTSSDRDAWLARATEELVRRLDQFSSFVHFIRGAVAPRSSKRLDREAFLGWCGEYVVHMEHDSWEWRGGYSAVDFFDQGESYEVKSGYGDPPEAPFFSVDQIEHAISRGEHHHLLTVGLAEDTFDDLFKRANELNREKHKSARIIVPDVAPWVHHLASDVGIPFHLVARVFATDDHFHELLRLLKKNAREVPVEPNPFLTATYEPLRHTIENDLIRGRFQVRLHRAARLIS